MANLFNNSRFFWAVFFVLCSGLYAEEPVTVSLLEQIEITGNAKVETTALEKVLTSQKGHVLSPSHVAEDLRAIFKLGFFSDLKAYQRPAPGGGVVLHIAVVEKPAITKIEYVGMKELKPEDLKEQLSTKLYTIVDDGKIASDVRLIERKYTEKGFYLAKVTSSLKQDGANEVALTYHVDEKGKVLVGDVYLMGHKTFSTGMLLDQFLARPFTRFNHLFGQTAYQEEMVHRDAEFLSYFYKDQGFAKVQVAQPVVVMDADKHFVRATFSLEEGKRYKMGTLKVMGDVGESLYTEELLLEKMKLRPHALFKYSYFQKDVEMLVNLYGDLGYAYADINPIPEFNDEEGMVNLTYEITKGDKVFFGHMWIVGNTKTRDQVIRREFEISDSELYSGTLLSKTKQNINRLGFFEDVQILKERDVQQVNVLNLKVKVKEKPTGHLQASVGFSPGAETKQSWSGQGGYEEKNQSGRAWNTNLRLKWANPEDYTFEVGFYDPKVNDSLWSYGINAAYQVQETRYADDIEVPEVRTSIGYSVGRNLFEWVRANVSLKHSYIESQEAIYMFDGFLTGGVKNTLSLGLGRTDLDNYIDPTAGSQVALNHQLNGGPGLGGDYVFQESTGDANVYVPLDFGESFRTYFKLHGFLGLLWPQEGKALPATERYRLGGYSNLRGYRYAAIGPYEKRGRSPLGGYTRYNKGGNKEFYFQGEYFVPIIPQAGIKGLLFVDTGRVFQEGDRWGLKEFKTDVGFGLRWITPIAPFRFEWAYPYDPVTRTLGNLEFILTLGF